MIIKDFKYFPFSLQLKIPFQSSAQIIKQRNGFIISLRDELGNQSFGEASPLINYSSELMDQVAITLRNLRSQLIDISIEESPDDVSQSLNNYKLVPSVRFALEQAILSLLIIRNKNFVNLFVGNLKSEINVNAVFGFEESINILSEIEGKINSGYNTIKLKVGRDNFEDDLKLIDEVRRRFGKNISIRLDANGKWEFEDAKNYLEQLSSFNIQYIEEPCTNLNDLIKLAEVSPIPIAVDESVHIIEDALEIINNSNIEFIVLKPMVLGGLFSTLRVINEAELKNKKVIISSSFESAIGKSGLVLLASITNHNFAHGLDTSEFFEKDICADSFKVEKGKITFTPENYPPQFNLKLT
ncbi:MAG: o-succinylbenzoate synthase [Ignavibacteriales bacterium]|nr:MAG: o-succinylbenzoate synthase [Ignavibacteriales bacterium]